MPDFPELPPVATQPLSLVLLAREAAPHVVALVRAWRDTLQTRGPTFEIIVVDDASTDQTAVRADELLPAIAELKVIRHQTPQGPGAALRTGLAATTCPLIACAPCAPDYRPQDLALFLADIDKVHLVTGYRAGRPVPRVARALGLLLRGLSWLVFSSAPRPLPGWLGWRGHLGALLARAFFGVRLRDVSCPFRLFRREVLARSPLQSDGEFVWVEQLAKVNFAGSLFPDHDIALPVVPTSRPLLRQLFREAYRVFTRPSFGPPVLADPTFPAPSK